MKIKKIHLLLLLVQFLFGCTYSFNMNSLPNLKTIYISDIINGSYEPYIEKEIEKEIRNLFESDNRLFLVTKNPDISLHINLLSYSENITKYDNNELVLEKEVSIKYKVNFLNNKEDSPLYKKEIQIRQRYSENSKDASIPSNKEDAIILSAKKLFDNIIINTLEKW